MTDMDKLTPQRARRRRPGDRMTNDERKQVQARFLDALGRTANISAACRAANISRSIVYVWQEMSDEFALRFIEANQQANDLLFAEAWRRSIVGETRYVIAQGKVVQGKDGNPLTIQEKSDSLLALLLKARLPEFREKSQIDINTNVNSVEIYKVRIPDNGRD